MVRCAYLDTETMVHRSGRRYELIAGHRRLEAVRRLGWEQVPVVLRSADADGAFVLQLVENLQRSDLHRRKKPPPSKR